MDPIETLEYELFGNSLLAWGTAAAVFVAAWLLLGIARRVTQSRLQTFSEAHEAMAWKIAAHTISQTRGWFLFLIALVIAAQFVVLPASVNSVLEKGATIGLLVQLGLWATAAFAVGMRLRHERRVAVDPSAVAAMDVLGFVLRVAIWTFVVLLALDNLGVEITALVAGLGIGGIAVALAVQNILGDLFASLSILLDKPFVGGDFLDVNGYLGSVEKIGIKTTRLRSISGEQLILSNNDLLNSRIRNYGRMFERRVVFTVGVTYQTPPDKLRRIPGILMGALEGHEKVRVDRAHFQKFGDSALIFEVVYYVTSADYSLYMDIQQEANLTIYEQFAEEQIEFAYPTQTLYVAQAEPSREPRSEIDSR
ncbi:MAG TPA: mechanosensitive ion channel family protein [Woeseiaceae bacterium]